MSPVNTPEQEAKNLAIREFCAVFGLEWYDIAHDLAEAILERESRADLIDALVKAGVLQEVRGRGGSLQPIANRRGSWRLSMESDAWMDGRVAYVVALGET